MHRTWQPAVCTVGWRPWSTARNIVGTVSQLLVMLRAGRCHGPAGWRGQLVVLLRSFVM